MNHSLYIAIIMLVGLLGGKLASKLKLPSVTGYIIFGMLLGPSFANVITKDMIKAFQFINQIALGILAISIGAELHRAVFKRFGKTLFLIAFVDGIITAGSVALLTYFFGVPIEFAIILGVLAMTVSPSGVLSIIKEYQAKGSLTRTLLALVAIENLNCILLFGVASAVLVGLSNTDMKGIQLILMLVKEISFAIIVGSLIGAIVAFVFKKKPNNSKLLVFLLGVILLNTGIANEFNLSALLINMTTGAVLTNLINRKMVLSSTLERVELPIFVMFLTLAGAKLDVSILATVGMVGAGYIIGRLLGKIGGSYISSGFTSLEVKVRRNIGMALTPQAGVAIGLSIIAEQKLPHSNGLITGIVLSGVIFFEVVGPLLLKKALKNTGDIY